MKKIVFLIFLLNFTALNLAKPANKKSIKNVKRSVPPALYEQLIDIENNHLGMSKEEKIRKKKRGK